MQIKRTVTYFNGIHACYLYIYMYLQGSRLGWMNDSMVSGPSRAEGPDVWQV